MQLDEALGFLRANHHSVLITRKTDGDPQPSPVVHGVDELGRVVISSREPAYKVRNLRRDPRATSSARGWGSSSGSSSRSPPSAPAPTGPADRRRAHGRVTDPIVVEQEVRGVGGVALHVRRHEPPPGLPIRPPVLAVHGLASNARLWDGVAGHLAAMGHPVAAVDQRGHGRSVRPAGGFDFETLTGDLRAVLDTLGWIAARRPLAAGQSWGGNVVLELGARHAGSVRALALVDGGTIELVDRFADWPTARAALTPPPLAGTPAEVLEAGMRRRHPDWPESGIAGAMANFEVLDDGTARPRLSLDNHLAILGHLWEQRPSQRYASVEVPVLIIPADEGPLVAPRFMATKRDEVGRAERSLPCAAVRWMVGDHDLHAQHPEAVAALLHEAAESTLFAT